MGMASEIVRLLPCGGVLGRKALLARSLSRRVSLSVSTCSSVMPMEIRRSSIRSCGVFTRSGVRVWYDEGIEPGSREGWFSEFYAQSRTWIATPPWFRSWVEHEQRAAGLRVWQLGVLSGLLQKPRTMPARS